MVTPRIQAVFVGVFFALLSSVPGAQNPPVANPPATKPAEQPTFRTRVDLVTTDAIVRDNRGQFVADLKKDDFLVLEDGIEQQVISFEMIHGGRAFNQLRPPPPPVQEGIILPPVRPPADTSGRIFILFVDDLHLEFRNTPRIRQLLQKMRKTLIHEGDMIGIVSTGPSSIAIDLTYDLKRLDEAIQKVSGGALRPTEIMQGPEGAEGPSEVRYRAHVAFSTAYDLVTKLEQVHNRRKSLIYVSNGYDFNPFPEGRYKSNPLNQARAQGSEGETQPDDGTDPFRKQGTRFAEADLARELAELTRAANRANATIYTIDPRGLVAGADIDEEVDPNEWATYVRTSQDSLRVIANETGGIAVVNQNDFDSALKRIDAETSDYYVLGYYSSNPDPTKRHRRIEIKVKRSGLSVMHRTAYTLKRRPDTSK